MKNEKIRQKAPAGLAAVANLSRREKNALKNSIQALNNQAESLGILDPLEMEPVLIYSLEEGKK